MRQSSSILSAMSLDKQHSPFVYTDEQLIARFQAGDEQAYVELVNRYRDRLMNFVFQFLGDTEQSEDVVQDTMLKLYEKKHYYREIAKFSTWIYTIARNLANTELRKRKRRKVTVLSADCTTEVTNYTYEERIEDKKRDIYLLKPKYLGVIKDDMEIAMTYKKGSTQYMSETLKKAENIKLYQ